MNVTPDGVRYVASASRRVARPFHYRWLIPRLCGESERRWRACSQISTFGLLPAVWWYVGGVRGLAAAGMLLGLAGVWKFNRRHPVLIDAPGMLTALAAADLARHGLWPAAIAVVLLAGCVRETAPVFSALWAWNPLLLVGLLPVAVRHLQRPGPDVLDEENLWILHHPIQASRKYHAGLPLTVWALPWGAGLVAAANVSPQLLVTLAVAYGQCAVATDTVRLYSWAFPVVLAAAVGAVPLAWLPVLVVLTVANPVATEGV